MRTYGRIIPDVHYPEIKKWIVITTDDNGWNDAVYMTTLDQTLKLNLGESPFFANYGIPMHQSIVTQVAPDLYMSITQQQFAQYFPYLSLVRLADTQDGTGAPVPTYQFSIITHNGAQVTNIAYGQPNTVL